MKDYIHYDFYGYDIDYEYDQDEAIDYLIRSEGPDTIIHDFIENGFCDDLSDADKKNYADYDGFDGTFESIANMSEDTKKEFATDVCIEPLIKETDWYEDELTQYFEDSAYEQYKDEKAYKKNPLGYYGLSLRDFM